MTLFCPQELFHHPKVSGQFQLVFKYLSCPLHSRHLLMAMQYREVMVVPDDRGFSPQISSALGHLGLPSPSATIRNISSQPPACEEIVFVRQPGYVVGTWLSSLSFVNSG